MGGNMKFILYSHSNTSLSRIEEDIRNLNPIRSSSASALRSLPMDKDDIVIIDYKEMVPKTVSGILSAIHSAIALYDRSIKEIPALLSYQHTVYLPYDYSEEELAAALDKAESTAEEIGTLKDILVGDSAVMERIRKTIGLIIKSKVRIFHIAGETGTGKNLIARFVHLSLRSKSKKDIYESCSALDGELAESRFFGHAKGAYTGATEAVEGIVAIADGGTLFLDEIEDLSIGMQSKMLHLIETGEYRSIGDDRMKKSSFLFITASNVDIGTLVEEKRMRADFFHRISGITIRMPSLSEHMEDIPRLIELEEEKLGKNVTERITDFTPFMNRAWKGNVRELFNAVEMYHVGIMPC